MKIPKSFQIGPHEITVKVVSKAEMEALDFEAPLGLWFKDRNEIYIQKAHRGFPKTQQQHTFWHEFSHAMFDCLSYGDLSADEQLVDLCGMVLLQAHQTFKF